MLSRPAFLARIPDPRSLRFRVLAGIGGVAAVFAALLVLAAVQLDARRCAEVARVRAETLAVTAGLWLDGDAHAGLGQDPQKRLSDLAATLQKALESSEYPGVVRTLRPKPEAKAPLAAQPGAARAGALEVVLQTGKDDVVRKDVDWRPEMRDAMFEGECVSLISSGEISTYAPVPDSWGASPAIVWVAGPASAPLWRRIVFCIGSALFAGLLVSFVLWLALRATERLEQQFATLDAGVRVLAGGRVPASFSLPGHAPRELADLSVALDALRARFLGSGGIQDLPQVAASAAVDQRRVLLGEAAEFDLALLLQQLVEPARKMAQARRVDVQLVFPDGVPSQLVGHPMILFRAIEALLRNAQRVTRQGRITLRVNRAGEAGEGDKLRFEVADTGPGVAFKEQQELVAALAEAAEKDPNTVQEPLRLASALVSQLGGELSFESQPGQGSRFGFTVVFRAVAKAAPTAFRPPPGLPGPGTGFQPRPELPPGQRPGPATGFTQRPPLAPGHGPGPGTGFQPRPQLPPGQGPGPGPGTGFTLRPKIQPR